MAEGTRILIEIGMKKTMQTHHWEPDYQHITQHQSVKCLLWILKHGWKICKSSIFLLLMLFYLSNRNQGTTFFCQGRQLQYLSIVLNFLSSNSFNDTILTGPSPVLCHVTVFYILFFTKNKQEYKSYTKKYKNIFHCQLAGTEILL